MFSQVKFNKGHKANRRGTFAHTSDTVLSNLPLSNFIVVQQVYRPFGSNNCFTVNFRQCEFISSPFTCMPHVPPGYGHNFRNQLLCSYFHGDCPLFRLFALLSSLLFIIYVNQAKILNFGKRFQLIIKVYVVIVLQKKKKIKKSHLVRVL